MKKLVFLLFAAFAQIAFGQNNAYKQEINIHREEYKSQFLTDPRSPLKKEDLAFLKFYPPNEKYRINCSFEATPDAQPFDLPTYSGITKPYVQFGILRFALDSATVIMPIYQSVQMRVMPKHRDHLFLPFKDLTNGETTYGGGRYLDLKISDIQNGKITVDFNKAYNPWCAYSDGYNCPIPPKANHLNLLILAGEMSFDKPKH